MITCKTFDKLSGKQIYEYTLQDKISVKLVTCGATLTAIDVPDAHGGITDVLLALTNSDSIVGTSSYMGSFIGRCANRIEGGEFTLNGKKYFLAKNCGGTDSLHGGNFGFNRKIFDAETIGNSLVFYGKSADGEENYPGNLDFSIKYTVEDSTLTIEYFGESDGDTVFGPTNHAYFNLDGQDSGDISQNIVQIFAHNFLPINKNLIPTGEVRNVCGTQFDFIEPKAIGRDINKDCEQLKLAGGYDHNFCLDGSVEKDGCKLAARAYSPKTGIVMECYTDMPGLQFYSGNFLNGEQGKATYPRRSGFCFETQFYPNSVNMPQWQGPFLKKGNKFYSKTKYVFDVKG